MTSIAAITAVSEAVALRLTAVTAVSEAVALRLTAVTAVCQATTLTLPFAHHDRFATDAFLLMLNSGAVPFLDGGCGQNCP